MQNESNITYLSCSVLWYLIKYYMKTLQYPQLESGVEIGSTIVS